LGQGFGKFGWRKKAFGVQKEFGVIFAVLGKGSKQKVLGKELGGI